MRRSNPFKRGALLFEDFNYAQVNPYILVRKAGTDMIKVSAETVKPTQQTLSQLEHSPKSSSQQVSADSSHSRVESKRSETSLGV